MRSNLPMDGCRAWKHGAPEDIPAAGPGRAGARSPEASRCSQIVLSGSFDGTGAFRARASGRVQKRRMLRRGMHWPLRKVTVGTTRYPSESRGWLLERGAAKAP